MRCDSKRSGFTLVELLVVIAIIGVLVGMLLPAVQAVREAANRTSCINNVDQMTLACINYQSTHLRFPAGAAAFRLDGGAMSTVSGSWLGSVLPYVEQQNIADQMTGVDTGVATDAQLIEDCHNFATANPVAMFFCPSATQLDKISNDPIRRGRTSHYVGNAGPSVNSANHSYDIYDPGNLGNGPIGLNGLFSPFSVLPDEQPPVYSFRLAYNYSDIRDGSSNTFAIGESSRSKKLDGSFVPHRVGWTFGANGTSNPDVDGYIPIEVYCVKSFGNNRLNENVNYLVDVENRNSHSYSSNHPGGAIFSRADGSTQFVSDNVEVNVLLELSSIAGGETTSSGGL